MYVDYKITTWNRVHFSDDADPKKKKKKLEDECCQIARQKGLSAPKCWIKADDFRPEYDGRYLAHIVTKEECGNFTKRLEVVYFGYQKWDIKENERITHWMIVLPPDRTVTLL